MRPLSHSATHVPGEYAQLRNASCVYTGCIDRDINRLAEVALRIAGLRALKKQFACSEGGEKITDLLTVISIHVAEVVQSEC